MKSRTSFSKLTTFKKDLTRFAPIWALYLIGMMLIFLETLSYGSSYDRLANNIPDLISAFGVVNVCYAAVCAVMLFGDLYNTRMCYSLHTIPARRETLFLSHTAAALAFSLVPNFIASLYMMIQLKAYWYLALYWLLAVELQFIFFFGVAAVSALLTGNRFAMLLMYAGFSFVSMLAYWIVDTIYLPQMTGVVLDFKPFSLLCPTVHLFGNFEFLEFQTISKLDPEAPYMDIMRTFYKYQGIGSGWDYLAALAVIGVVLLGVAVLLYRIRHLESAGDFVAFRKLSPVLCVVMTLCVAGVFTLVGTLGNSYVIWLFVGLVVGYFGSLMLLERRIKVFRAKTFIGLGILAAVLVGSFLMISYDVLGIVSWTPAADRVESVTISNNYVSGMNYDNLLVGNVMTATLTDADQIEEIIEAHEDILNRLGERGDLLSSKLPATHRITFMYRMKSGATVIRTYNAPASGVNYEILRKYLYTPASILGYTDWEAYVNGVEYLSVDGNDIPAEYYKSVMEALKADCEQGKVVPYQGGQGVSFVELTVHSENNGHNIYRSLSILEGANYTAAELKRPALVLGSTDWEALAENMNWISVEGYNIPEQYYKELMEALWKDCQAGNITLGVYKTSAYFLDYRTLDGEDKYIYRSLGVSESAENTLAWIKEHESEFGK